MHIERLFNALVLGGAAIGIGCSDEARPVDEQPAESNIGGRGETGSDSGAEGGMGASGSLASGGGSAGGGGSGGDAGANGSPDSGDPGAQGGTGASGSVASGGDAGANGSPDSGAAGGASGATGSAVDGGEPVPTHPDAGTASTECSATLNPGDPCGCPCCWIVSCMNDEPCCESFCVAGDNGNGCCGP